MTYFNIDTDNMSIEELENLKKEIETLFNKVNYKIDYLKGLEFFKNIQKELKGKRDLYIIRNNKKLKVRLFSSSTKEKKIKVQNTLTGKVYEIEPQQII